MPNFDDDGHGRPYVVRNSELARYYSKDEDVWDSLDDMIDEMGGHPLREGFGNSPPFYVATLMPSWFSRNKIRSDFLDECSSPEDRRLGRLIFFWGLILLWLFTGLV